MRSLQSCHLGSRLALFRSQRIFLVTWVFQLWDQQTQAIRVCVCIYIYNMCQNNPCFIMFHHVSSCFIMFHHVSSRFLRCQSATQLDPSFAPQKRRLVAGKAWFPQTSESICGNPFRNPIAGQHWKAERLPSSQEMLLPAKSWQVSLPILRPGHRQYLFQLEVAAVCCHIWSIDE